MSEWKECTLGEVLNLRRGYDLPHSKMIEGIIPVAGSNGIIGTHNIATDIEPCITVGRSGSAGSTFFYDKAWAHNTTLYIDDFKGNDPKYLYYLLLSLPLKKMAGGSAVPSLNRNHIHPLKIRFPFSIEKQRAIASILSSLDAKIENNRKICANLEAQAQALFKHWFIDFAPFKAGKFVESELGMIPEGWRVGKLGEIAEFVRGKTITKGETKEGNIPVVAGGLEPAYYHNKSNTSSRVVTISGSGANAGFTRMYFSPIWASDCSYIDNESTAFLHTAFCYLLTNKKKVNALQWGAAQPHVYAKDINKLPLVIAPSDVLTHFEGFVVSMFDSIDLLEKESSRLSTLRDTLLPKLMSGEIKV